MVVGGREELSAVEVVVCGRVSVVCEKEWLGSGRVWLFAEWCDFKKEWL